MDDLDVELTSSPSSAADLLTIANENGDIHPPVSSPSPSTENLAIRRQTSTYFLALRLSASSASITPTGIKTPELRTKRKLLDEQFVADLSAVE